MVSPSRPFKRSWRSKSNCVGYALDNGAWSYFKKGIAFKERPFLQDVDEFGSGADFVVIPDVVGNKDKTLRLADQWIPRLKGLSLCFVAQDGMDLKDLSQYTKEGIGIFIGGSTEYKLSMIGPISRLCNAAGVISHVGRVNSKRRLYKCIKNAAFSFDGSGPAIFKETARILTDELILLQQDLFPRGYNFTKLQEKYLHDHANTRKEILQKHAKE